jgi:hypothetical protein
MAAAQCGRRSDREGAAIRANRISSGRTFCVFELGPYPGDGCDVIVVEGIDEVLLDRIFEGSFDRVGEVPSALGEADERHPTVALVGPTLEVPGIDQFLNQP